jgi:redox-sensitive bicupin YhaK (pirin superfamily)
MEKNVSHTRYVQALEVSEGAGVTVHRTIGTPTLRNLDPFMLLDFFCSDDPGQYIAGFPSHPHRGFCTFTYMLDGAMQHKDSMGNTGHLGPGSAQWMKAGSGVIHSEMPQQENGLMRGFQLWINLPAAHKMDHPEYQEYAADAFPINETDDYQLKLIIGQLGNLKAPIIDDITQALYVEVQLRGGCDFSHRVADGHNGFVFMFEGDALINGRQTPGFTLAAPTGDQRQIDIRAGDQGARFLIISGRPIGEPVVQYGPFVMNSRDEINEAMRDYQNNTFVRDRAWINRRQSSAGENVQ